MNKTYDAIVIGGGIIGCAIAESLARQGLRVALAERGLIGREASWAAAGMLAPSSEMETPGSYFEFCLRSRRMYGETATRIREASGIDPQYRTEGMFYVAFSEAEERQLRERAAWQRAEGVDVIEIDGADVRRQEPSVAHEVRTAMHFTEDHQLDPRLMTRGFAVAARRWGARIQEHTPVLGLKTEGDRITGVEVPGESWTADTTILAAGCWSALLPTLPVRLPIYPVKGQVLMLQAASPLFSHIMHSADVYMAPRYDGRIVIGATEEHEAGFDKSVEAGVVADLIARAKRVIPEIEKTNWVDAWAGLRPGTADRRPLIGPSGREGLILATGHFRSGILLAPLTADLISELVMSGVTDESLTQFAPERFEGDPNPSLRSA